MITCSECGKTYSPKGIATHMWRAHGEGRKHDPNRGYGEGTRDAWNRGLDKSDPRVKKNAEAVSETVRASIANGTHIPRRMGKAARESLSRIQSENNRGGKCRWFEVDGKKVQGTWEKKVAEELTAHNIAWERCKPIAYDFFGKPRHYTPDFYLPDTGVYLEVKGHWWGRDLEKMDCVTVQHPGLKVLIIEGSLYRLIVKDFDILLQRIAAMV